MSAEGFRELLALLSRLAEAEFDDDAEDEIQAEVRTQLRPLVGPSIAERVEYTRYEFEVYQGVKTVQGLALISSELLFIEILEPLLLRMRTNSPTWERRSD